MEKEEVGFSWDNVSDTDFLDTETVAEAEAKVEAETKADADADAKVDPPVSTPEEKKKHVLDTLDNKSFWEAEGEDTVPSDVDTASPEKIKEILDKKEKADAEAKAAESGGASEDEITEFYTSKAKLMIEKGIFSTIDLAEEIEEGEVLDEAKYISLQQKELDNRVNGVIDGWKNELGQVGSDFVRYTLNGGSPENFISQVSETPDFSKYDLSNEAQVDQAGLTYLTRIEGKDAEEAKDLLAYYKDKGTLDAKVAAWKDKTVANQRKQVEQMVADQEKENNTRIRNKAERKAAYEKLATTVDSVSGVKLQKEAKKYLASYVTDAVHKVEGTNQYLSDFSRDLQEIFKDKESMLALASIVKRYNKEGRNFDLSDIIAEGKKEKVEEIKNTLLRKKESNTAVANSQANTSAVKSLADIL